MAQVTIYQFQVYDIQSDEIVKSKRCGTAKAIREIVGGEILEDTAVEVEESVVRSDIPGLTAINFDPHARTGFQTAVKR
jgi:hypothetical protein